MKTSPVTRTGININIIQEAGFMNMECFLKYMGTWELLNWEKFIMMIFWWAQGAAMDFSFSLIIFLSIKAIKKKYGSVYEDDLNNKYFCSF